MICHQVLVLGKRKLDWKISKVEGEEQNAPVNTHWTWEHYLSGNHLQFERPGNL